VQKCDRTLAHREQKRGVRSLFYLLHIMHMKAVWQSFCVCATKNC